MRAYVTAAAVLFLLAFWAWNPERRHDPSDELGHAIQLLQPDANSESFAEFRWRMEVELPVGGRYELIIHEDEQGHAGTLLDKLTSYGPTSLQLESSKSEAWPEAILWRVEALGPDGTLLGTSPWQDARRKGY